MKRKVIGKKLLEPKHGSAWIPLPTDELRKGVIVLLAPQCVELAERAIGREFHACAQVFVLDLQERLRMPLPAPGDARRWTSAPRSGRWTTPRRPGWAPTSCPAAPGFTCR